MSTLSFFGQPRSLYFVIFLWISVTGAGFVAPLLEHEAHFDQGLIGTTLALQWLFGGLASGLVGGSWADAMEKKLPGVGRIYLLCIGVFGGTLCLLGHGIHRWFPLLDSVAWHMGVRFVFAVVTSLSVPALDGLTLTYLDQHETLSSSDYGQERLYGGVAWAIGNLLLGLGLDRFDFVAMYVFSILAAWLVVVASVVYVKEQRAHNKEQGTNDIQNESTPLVSEKPSAIAEEPAGEEESMFDLIALLFASIYGIGFIVSFLTLSAGTNIVEGMVFTYFEGVLGASYTFCGLTVLMTVLWEIPIFAISPRLLRRFGAGVLQQVAGWAYVTRVVGYSIIPTDQIWIILCLEPLHGVTYACSQTSAVEFAAERMPVGREAAGQGLVMMGRSVGAFFGLMGAGWLQQTVGGRWMYRIFATIVGVGMAIYAAATIVDPQSKEKDSTTSRDTETGTPEHTVPVIPRASWTRDRWSSASAEVSAAKAELNHMHLADD